MAHNRTSYGVRSTVEVPTSPEPLLTIDGLARLLAVDRKTVYRLPIPHVIVGTRRRYLRADVDAYLERSREPAP
jgi:excisionase family DNA binding protein